MRIFFLDDSKQRIHKAHSRLAGHFIAALDAPNAIAHLSQPDACYDVISLDHDLIGVYCPSDEQSGYAVAAAVAKLPNAQLPKKVIVHSYNYDAQKTPPHGGVGNMLEVLECLTWQGVTVKGIPFDTPEYWAEVEKI